jgi:hypothetical protein
MTDVSRCVSLCVASLNQQIHLPLPVVVVRVAMADVDHADPLPAAFLLPSTDGDDMEEDAPSLDGGQFDAHLQMIRELEQQLKQAIHPPTTAHPTTLQVTPPSSANSKLHQSYAQQQQLFKIRKRSAHAHWRCAIRSLLPPSTDFVCVHAVFVCVRSLRSAYVRCIVGDFSAAFALDLESALWKHTVYKQIEGLRKLLNQCTPQPTSKKFLHQWTRSVA